ncbi:FadR/GntR family transcriptional regulator [Algihabitans albus]|uniref:FadR/GntR family transcriptional regulator n=1 Tax=Algihabitans albus TaxID=2164067 RepID=UPI001F3F1716|nr:FCD domain-containing protein [Algihabitans albus]
MTGKAERVRRAVDQRNEAKAADVGSAEIGPAVAKTREPHFAKLKVAPAYRVVFETIEEEILSGRLRPGDRLPSETALAGQLGVNRSTAREGLRLLEQTGLVRREGGRRLFAAVPRQEELSSRASRALVLQQVTFRELWEVLMVTEPGAAALAAERIGAEQIRALEDNLARTVEAVELGRSFTQLDIEFHGMVTEATGNPAWILAREPAALLLFPAADLMMPQLPQSGHRLVEAHSRVLAALKSGEARVAEDWMRKHIVDFRRGYEMAGISIDVPVDREGALPETARAKDPVRVRSKA